MRRSQSALALCCIFLIIFLQSSSAISIDVPADLQHGPFIDKVVYRVINGYESRIQALLTGEIDIDAAGFIDFADLLTLSADPGIEVAESPRNGYGSIVINCARYPFNISGFRRAFAFAFNKTKVMNDIFDGHASLHDSLVPSVNRWCAEDFFDYHYYDAEPEIGNTILDELGFTIDGSTGFRNAPNGNPFSVTVLFYGWSTHTNDEIANIAVEALQSLNVSADYSRIDFWVWPPYPPYDDNFDMIILGRDFSYDNVDWLVSCFGSEYVDFLYNNPSNFRNDTYDFWIDQLQNGTTYEEIYAASVEMQKILHYNVPQLVAYQNTVMQGYRNDQFEGHVEGLERHISDLWTLRKIRRIDGIYGGTINVALEQEPDSFNIYTTNSPYSKMILDNLYSSLYSRNPNMNPIPDLVESMLVEIQSNNSVLPSNHMRFTFDIIHNATWSDGEPLTAEDVAFTFNYVHESGAYGNPAADILTDLMTAYAPSTYQVVIEFSTESYLHFYNIAYQYIIPKHIFTIIGYSGWNWWNPVFDPEAPHVTCGPFIFDDCDPGEFYEISANTNYHWYIPPPPPSTSTPTPQPQIPFPLLEFVLILSTSTVVTIIVGSLIVKKKFDVRLF